MKVSGKWAIALGCWLSLWTAWGVGAEKPNIVLIMCDDMGFSDIGCYGGEIRTPNIDRLAAEGVRFTQFYNNGKCTTTRASLVTGLYPRQKAGLLTPNMVTLGEVLKEAGYQTSLSGKWHLGSNAPKRPIDRGFEEFYGLLDGCCNFFNPNQPDPSFKGGKVRVFAHNDKRLTEFPDDFYTTDAFTTHAIDTMRKFSETGRPFFLHLCYTAPHYPLHAKPEDIAKYKGKYMQGWDELRQQRHKRQVEMGLIDPQWKLPARESEAKAWGETENHEWNDLRMAVYAAMIDSMDQNIGRLLAALKDVGAEKNTIVLFFSDNGGCAEKPGGENTAFVPGPKEFYTACGPGWAFAQNTPFRRYKSWAHEGGIATPLVVRWPDHVKPNTITQEVGHIIDILPTFVELSGGQYPQTYQNREILPVEGLSLLPVLQGGTRKAHDMLYWEWAGNRALRQGDWKLAWDSKQKRWELYNLKSDRTETHDLASTQPDRVAQLSEAWYAWADRTGAKYTK